MKLGMGVAAFAVVMLSGCMSSQDCANMCKPRGVIYFSSGNDTCVCDQHDSTRQPTTSEK